MPGSARSSFSTQRLAAAERLIAQHAVSWPEIRRLEITAGAPKHTRRSAGIWSTNDLMRTAEREVAQQAEASYRRMVQDQQAGGPARKVARARHRSAHSLVTQRGQAARQTAQPPMTLGPTGLPVRPSVFADLSTCTTEVEGPTECLPRPMVDREYR
jgi:hypothetical protein